jgi:very-short-patch-repair endonuclease
VTRAEIILWSRLKGKQMLGYKFRRQYSVGSYVIDFYCPELKFAIEIDGPTHFEDEAKEYDENRQKFIESFRITFLRFNNMDVYNNLEGVLKSIMEKVQAIEKYKI